MSKRFWTFPYSGMLLLAAGSELYRKVDMQDYLDAAAENRSPAVRFIGLFLAHPYIPRRLENLRENLRGRA